MLKELGISGGTFILVCIVLYFVIKWAVAAGMSKTNSHLRDILEIKGSGQDPFENLVGKTCKIHIRTDSEYYFKIGAELNAKVSSAKSGWVELTDIGTTGSGSVTIRITDILYVEEM